MSETFQDSFEVLTDAEVEASFLSIVETINNSVTPEMAEAIAATPTRKPAGTADQGYRFD